ncbi:type II secretion system protein GspE [Enterobacillus tribolii]|uniref:Protein transport protein HofB n=1 Tax=Enterobacillus tribolii TaxID=1487935 RepID=A0A370R1U4_9GAMM|nr:type II secretion system protein GspE [Enterobacillus tribolii]MBW7983031.1 type II secretion system protein GspE [Enterobacillus tribolii]RDK95865.1 protein transport protein HofB [Enterobacillus tribolii]
MASTDASAAVRRLCRQHQYRIVEETPQTLTLAAPSAPDETLLQTLRFASGKTVIWQHWQAAQLESRQTPVQNDDDAPEMPAEDARTEEALDELLRLALERRASDIHLEPRDGGLQVRLRIDGVLQPLNYPFSCHPGRIIPRLKVLAGLDIAERRLPQDGQLTLELHQTAHTLRIATLPVREGEKAVLRVVQEQNTPMTLEQLGLDEDALQQYRQILKLPQGLILVTGPTGSGKTVTLYSSLNYLNAPGINICSVEDPIESPLPGINQTAINTKAGLQFNTVLRALLRQDPDVIMIGEIRDAETASIAINAAQTGHLVLSTLHTNSACETLIRLAQLGISPHLLAGSIRLVIAQRLVRRLCPHCRYQDESAVPPPPGWQGVFRRWKAAGCPHCIGGYYGRTAVYEFLPVGAAIQHVLLNGGTAADLQRAALRQETRTLWQTALQLAHRGETSCEEVMRVLGDPLS